MIHVLLLVISRKRKSTAMHTVGTTREAKQRRMLNEEHKSDRQTAVHCCSEAIKLRDERRHLVAEKKGIHVRSSERDRARPSCGRKKNSNSTFVRTDAEKAVSCICCSKKLLEDI